MEPEGWAGSFKASPSTFPVNSSDYFFALLNLLLSLFLYSLAISIS